MKKIFTILLTLVFTNIWIVSSQVGININNPTDALHLGRRNSTIRIDGLNSTNNAVNDGLKDKRVYVDADGTLMIKDDSPTASVNVLGNTTIPLAIPIISSTGAKTTLPLSSGFFITTGNHWVNLITNVAVRSIRNNLGGEINDSRAKIIGIELYVDGDLINTNTQTYMSTTNSGTIVDGIMYLNCDYFKLMTPGLHTYEVRGFVQGGGSIQGTFGGDSMDKIQIIEFN